MNRHFGEGLAPVVKLAVYALGDLNSAFTGLNQIVPGLGDDVAAVGGGALGLSAALGAISLVMPSVGARLTRLLLAPAKLLTAEFKAAAEVLGLDLPAGLKAAGVAMDQFTAKTMQNPLIRTGVLVAWLAQDLHERMNQGKPIDDMTPGERRAAGIMPTGPGSFERGSGIRRAPWPRHEPADERPHSFGWRRRCARAAAGHR